MPETRDDLDVRAERIYAAVSEILRDRSTMGLLVAFGDAKDKIPWGATHPKTRELFYHLAVNLTDKPPTS